MTRSRVLNVDSSASRLEGDAGSLQASTDNWGKTCVRLANIHFGGLRSGQNIYWHFENVTVHMSPRNVSTKVNPEFGRV